MKRTLLCAIAAWLVATTALAQETPGSKEEASAHFRQGVELFREGAYRAALVELQRAYEIAPDYRVLFNIGQTQLQLGEYVAAIRAFEAYLVQGGSNVDARRREEVENDLASLRKRVATLSISVNVEGATITVDGENVGKSPLATTVPVSVGRHRVFAQSEDGANAQQVIDVAGGDLKEISLTLAQPKADAVAANAGTGAALAPPPPRFTKRQRWGIGLLAGGGALGAGALAMGILAKNAHEDLGDAQNSGAGDKGAVDDARRDVKTYAIASDAMLVGAIGLAATGVYLLVFGGDDGSEAPKDGEVSVKVGLGPTGLRLRGRF